MSRRLWTPEEDARLLAMRAQRKTLAWLAVDLNRPLSSIASRLRALNNKRDKETPQRDAPAAAAPTASPRRLNIKEGGFGERKPRKCLCCGNTFPSAHAGNRLCSRCRGQSFSPFEIRV